MAGAFVSWLPWAYAHCAKPMYRHWGDEVGNHGEPKKAFMVTIWFMYIYMYIDRHIYGLVTISYSKHFMYFNIYSAVETIYVYYSQMTLTTKYLL